MNNKDNYNKELVFIGLVLSLAVLTSYILVN